MERARLSAASRNCVVVGPRVSLCGDLTLPDLGDAFVVTVVVVVALQLLLPVLMAADTAAVNAAVVAPGTDNTGDFVGGMFDRTYDIVDSISDACCVAAAADGTDADVALVLVLLAALIPFSSNSIALSSCRKNRIARAVITACVSFASASAFDMRANAGDSAGGCCCWCCVAGLPIKKDGCCCVVLCACVTVAGAGGRYTVCCGDASGVLAVDCGWLEGDVM